MDRVHHSLEHRIEDSPRLFRVAIGQELRRALDVGEEDGDLLALTLQRGARVEDALGEVLGRVRLGCRGGADAAGISRMRALRAELRGGWELGPAASTGRLERRRAFDAELRPGRVLVATSRTAQGRRHERSPTLLCERPGRDVPHALV